MVYRAVVSSAPSGVPPSRNCTPTTPTLSDALALTVTLPETVALLAGAVIETVGGVVSGGGGLATENAIVKSSGLALVAASLHRT